MSIDLSWWPYLTVPFPYCEGGLVVNFTWLDQLLIMFGRVVGPLLLATFVFFAARALFVNWKGGE